MLALFRSAGTFVWLLLLSSASPQGPIHIHISQVDHIIECTEPVGELQIPPISPIEEAIGGYLAEIIEDGSTLQLGYGGIPNAVCKSLLKKRDLGLHTEMVTDGMVDLMLSGYK